MNRFFLRPSLTPDTSSRHWTPVLTLDLTSLRDGHAELMRKILMFFSFEVLSCTFVYQMAAFHFLGKSAPCHLPTSRAVSGLDWSNLSETSPDIWTKSFFLWGSDLARPGPAGGNQQHTKTQQQGPQPSKIRKIDRTNTGAQTILTLTPSYRSSFPCPWPIPLPSGWARAPYPAFFPPSQTCPSPDTRPPSDFHQRLAVNSRLFCLRCARTGGP